MEIKNIVDSIIAYVENAENFPKCCFCGKPMEWKESPFWYGAWGPNKDQPTPEKICRACVKKLSWSKNDPAQ